MHTLGENSVLGVILHSSATGDPVAQRQECKRSWVFQGSKFNDSAEVFPSSNNLLYISTHYDCIYMATFSAVDSHSSTSSPEHSQWTWLDLQ